MSDTKPKRPAPKSAFKPGQSGNPGGRPKAEGFVREIAQQMSEEAIHKLGQIMRNDEAGPRVQAMAANFILDRAVGKPAQAVVHSGAIDTGKATVAELAATFTPDQLAMLGKMDPRIAALVGTTPTEH